MKQKNLLYVLMGIIIIGQALSYNYIILGGIGLCIIISSIFQSKKYDSHKLQVEIYTLIFAISLILTYFQVSSASYSGNPLIAYGLAILFLLLIIMGAYDTKHDNRFSKILQMNNVSQKNKDIIAIGLLIMGIILGLWLGIYFYKI